MAAYFNVTVSFDVKADSIEEAEEYALSQAWVNQEEVESGTINPQTIVLADETFEA